MMSMISYHDEHLKVCHVSSVDSLKTMLRHSQFPQDLLTFLLVLTQHSGRSHVLPPIDQLSEMQLTFLKSKMSEVRMMPGIVMKNGCQKQTRVRIS